MRVQQAQRQLTQQYVVSRSLNQFLTDQFIAMADPSVSGRKDVTVAQAAREAALKIDEVFAGQDRSVRLGLHIAMQKTLVGLSDYSASEIEGRKALELIGGGAALSAAEQAQIRIDLANTLIQQTKLPDAEVQLAAVEALPLPFNVPSRLSAELAELRANVATQRLALAEALELYQRAWDLARHATDITADMQDDIHLDFADALRMASHLPEAETEATALLALERQRLGPDSPRTCTAMTLLAAIQGYLSKFDSAIPGAARAAQCLNTALGSASVRTAAAYDVLAGLYFQTNRYAEAADAYRNVAALYASLIGPQAMSTLMSRSNAAVSRQYAGDARGAEPELQALLADTSMALGWTHPTTQTVRYHLADCRLDLQSSSEVAHLLDDISVTALREGELGEDWAGRVDYQRGRLAVLRGERPHAIELFKLAAEDVRKGDSDGRVTEAVIARTLAQLQGHPRGT